MEAFTVQVFPVARPDEWAAFMESAERGDRAAAHRDMLRRLGVTHEHVYRQDTPGGTVMVLIWEGMDQSEVGKRMAELIENPQTEHERHIATHVIPVIHGIDPTAGSPPQMQKVATIDT